MYRLKDVMEMFRIPERSIRRHLKEGLLEGRKVSGLWQFSQENLEAYLKCDCVQKHIRDEGYRTLSDYYHAYVTDKQQVVYMCIQPFTDQATVDRFMAVVKTFQYPFTLNCQNRGNCSVFMYKGQPSDLKTLMEWGETFEITL